MDPVTIANLLGVATQLATTIRNMIAEAKGDLSADDEAMLQQKAAELRAANDTAYDALQAKLQRAAQQP